MYQPTHLGVTDMILNIEWFANFALTVDSDGRGYITDDFGNLVEVDSAMGCQMSVYGF